MTSTRRAAVLGGNRIPFARQFGAYAEASNQDMLTAALEGLVARHGLAGERLGEVVAGCGDQAQPRLQPHPRGGARLEPVADHARLRRHPGLRHRARGRHPRREQDRAGSGRLRHRRWRRLGLGRPRRGAREAAPQAAAAQPRQELDRAGQGGARLPAHRRRRSRCPPTPSRAPACRWASTWPSPPQRWGVTREDQDALALASHQQPRRRLRPRLLRRPAHALPRPHPRPEPAPRLHPREARLAQAGVRPGRGRDDDRRQLHAAHRRRLRGAARLAGVGGGPRAAPRWPGSSTARRPRSTTSPATRACSWRPRTPCRACSPATGSSLQDFDFYEIHEAFAATVLSTLAAWEDDDVLPRAARAGRAARCHRPRPAQRQRLLARRRSPVRRDRWAHRRDPRRRCSTRRGRARAA